MLREAQAEKNRLLEHRVHRSLFLTFFSASACLSKNANIQINEIRMCFHSPLQEREMELRRQALEDERRRREDLERRLQEETNRRQKLVEREVNLRERDIETSGHGREED